MDLKNIFKKDDAVSPVIGVVLMVAITVILAAAIGSSVFGQGTAESAPQSNIDIKAVAPAGANPAVMKIEHLGGDPINFMSNSTTKVVAEIDGKNYEIVADSDFAGVDPAIQTFEVGETVSLKLVEYNGPALTSNTTINTVTSGTTVYVKIIDVGTSQLICDKEVRF